MATIGSRTRFCPFLGMILTSTDYSLGLPPMLPLKPEECASPIMRALVGAYRNSRHGRTGAGQRRFIDRDIDCLSFFCGVRVC